MKIKILLFFLLNLLISTCFAKSLGAYSADVTVNFGSLAHLIYAGCYIAGTGFGIGALLRYKTHREHPTQVPISMPIALALVAAAFIFLPSAASLTGHTIFTNSVVTTKG